MLKFGFCLKFGFSFAVIFAIFLEWLGFGFDFIDFLLVRKNRTNLTTGLNYYLNDFQKKFKQFYAFSSIFIL